MQRKRGLMVYVLDKDGKPLMPTNRHGKVRHLLKDGKAKCVKREPFTIQLLYDTPGRTQPVHLGVDAGSKHVGLSACTNGKELYSAECELRTDINKNLETRRSLRRSRRNRKTKYRKARFQNRRRPKGWLAPSVRGKADCHVTLIRKVMEILPVSEITIEMAPFDTQKLKADILGLAAPKGTDYQHGEAEGYDNIKAYVKWHGGIRKRYQAPYEVFGFRLGDKVLCKGKTGFIHGRRSSGSFDIRTLGGDVISHGISYKKLKLLEPTHNVLIERRKAFPPTTEVMGFHA